MEPSDTPTHNAPSDAEIARWKARGGIDLSRIEDPEERWVTASHIRVGVYENGKRYRFRCPMCGRVEVNNQEMPPACTGPRWTDDHPLEPMERIPD